MPNRIAPFFRPRVGRATAPLRGLAAGLVGSVAFVSSIALADSIGQYQTTPNSGPASTAQYNPSGSTIAIGINAQATSPIAAGNSIAIGTDAAATYLNTIAIGGQTTASGQDSIAIGNSSHALGGPSFGTSATGPSSTVIGVNSLASGSGSVALGNSSQASSLFGVALGFGSVALRPGLPGTAEAFSGATYASFFGAVSVGDVGSERQIINVEGGTMDTDAINLRQLRGAGNDLANSLGGGAGFDTNTSDYTPPTYAIGGMTYNDVGSALVAADQNITDLRGSIENGTIGLVQQNSATRNLTVGAATDGTVVDFANVLGSARTLTNVANGQIAAASTDAVNGGQIHAISASVAQNLGGGSAVNPDGSISAPAYRVNGTTYNNVGGAVAALDYTGVKYDVDPATGARGNSVTLQGGDPNQPVLIRNVATGHAATDAANTGQVTEAKAEAFAYTDTRIAVVENQIGGLNGQIADLQTQVGQLRTSTYQAAAIGLAAASLRYDDRPGKLSTSIGTGFWQGQSATAMGLGYTLPDDRVRVNASAVTAGHDFGFGAGASFTLN